ncbi:uncharacterized protein [Mycetomoellerius zeteki]|uniref:uncharacterized protein n=1 Tax=Mycetomoellerius zeteki TaxID=64791 RepID=UPI00084E5A70|nr:PREDICTED: uncharacterized protein LOC108729318 [Trachymyrmex zeteki]
MAEGDFAVAIVSEPYAIPRDHPLWYANEEKTITITWRRSENSLPCVPIERGRHHVIVKWGDMIIIGVYLSPNIETSEVERAMEEVERCVLFHHNKPIIMGGDFNAKTEMWESPVTNPRGIFLTNWVSNMGLICLNSGERSTCVRSTGESIVDITFANRPAAARVINWEVSMMESASDHRYIEIIIGKTSSQTRKELIPRPKRWSLKKLDEDLLRAAILAGSWGKGDIAQQQDVEMKAIKLQRIVTEACDTAMPRSTPRSRRAMPCWSEDLALLRDASTRARRKMKRARRHENPEDLAEAEQRINEYKETKKNFSRALRKAKFSSIRKSSVTCA